MSIMGRKLTKPRPKQGAHLAALRKATGLSQYQLAALVAEPQANIALWERSSKPPRSDALPKLALALGVSVADLLLSQDLKKLSRSKSKAAPPSKLQQAFDQAALLPRSQQDKIADFIFFFINKFLNSKSKTSSKSA